jgi:CRP-like cAMP-binding protein
VGELWVACYRSAGAWPIFDLLEDEMAAAGQLWLAYDAGSGEHPDAARADVRRVVAAFAAVTTGEWVLGTAAAFAAYRAVGPLAVGLVGLRFVAAAMTGLFASRLSAGRRAERLLTATALARASAAGSAALVLALGGPFALVVALVWADAAVGSAYRPAQATLLPAVVRTPAQLTAAVTNTSNAKSLSQVLGAFGGSLLVAAASSGVAAVVATGLYVAAALESASITPTTPAARGPVRRSRVRQLVGGVAAIRRNVEAARVAAWSSMRSLLRGIWTSLGVIAALQILGMGESGFGILMIAAGVGAVAAVPPTRVLVGRRGLAAPFAGAMALCAAALAGVGVTADAEAALALMVIWGLGMAVADAAAQALLNRVVSVGALAPVTGATETAKLLSEGLGALLGPAAASLGGVRGALIATGGLALLAVVADERALLRIDRTAAGRVRTLELMHGVPLFAPLRLEALAAIVARTRPERVAAGTDVIRQDELGDRWYLLAEGTLEVMVDGHRVRRLQPGEAFGERALLRDDRRSATVSALTDAQLLALDRADFLAAVAGAEPRGGEAPRTALDTLGRQPLLRGATRAVIAALADAASTLDLAAGETVVSKGRDDDWWFVVLDGRLIVQLDDRPSRRLLPGDSFGEIGVLHSRPRTATVVADTRARLVRVPGGQLRRALATAS